MATQPQPRLIGECAPDFRLHYSPSQTLCLHHMTTQRVIVAFCPAVWEPTTKGQLALYQQSLHLFHERNATLVAISVDGVWCHMAFAHHHRITYHLLSDGSPKGAVARAYGVYDEERDMARRALFLIQDRRIAWQLVVPDALNPGLNGILTALEELSE
ncbi:MAG: redoxin domain-containing protein [Chloroflexales bacterium]|nr:redoxin domain-containing protein [Chloroflexales bacterium]